MSHVDSVQFHLIPVRTWYEKQEMIEDARAYGFAVTESLFDDWIEKGLLGPAHREGRGRGRGSFARWPFQQYTLLLELLRARQQESCASANSALFLCGDGSIGENWEGCRYVK